MDGFIKLHRRMLDWEWWDNPIMIKVWLQILFEANYTPKLWKGVTIERGQLPYGRISFAKRCGITEHKLRLCMERLETSNQITIKTSNQFSVITVCQYELYQSNGEKTSNDSSDKRPTETSSEPSTPKEVKNKKKIYTSWNNPDALRFGTHVRLLKEEYDSMVESIGEAKTKDLIERFNGYIDQKGETYGHKNYKSHKATMMNWNRNDKPKEEEETQGLYEMYEDDIGWHSRRRA